MPESNHDAAQPTPQAGDVGDARAPHGREEPAGDGDGGNRAGALAAMGVVAVLVGCGLWLTHVLGGAASIQDCMASGRTNCAPVAVGGGQGGPASRGLREGGLAVRLPPLLR
jgi:hypothetical protein